MRRVLGVLLLGSVAWNTVAGAQQMPGVTGQRGDAVMKHAIGGFEIKVAPAEVSEAGKAGGVGRMTIEKIFSGELEGTSKGEMLTGITPTTGSMAYVAIETVTAKLDGRSGTFVLSHHATMMKSHPADAFASIAVVPGSGTGGFVGLQGTMTITNAEGKHSYSFAYEMPNPWRQPSGTVCI